MRRGCRVRFFLSRALTAQPLVYEFTRMIAEALLNATMALKLIHGIRIRTGCRQRHTLVMFVVTTLRQNFCTRDFFNIDDGSRVRNPMRYRT